MKRNRRRSRLIDARLQGRFILCFAVVASLSVLVHGIFVNLFLGTLADDLPNDAALMTSQLSTLLLLGVGITLLVVVPIAIGFGILATFRVAGPLYRFKQYLGVVAEGEDPGPCRIRQGDELQDLCNVLNRALDRLRVHSAAEAPAEAEEDAESEPLQAA